MATRILSTRINLVFRNHALQNHVINITRNVRRRRSVVNTERTERFTEADKHVNADVLVRRSSGGRVSAQKPDTVTRVKLNQRNENKPEPVKLPPPREKKINSHPRYGEINALLYERSQPGDKSITKLLSLLRSKKLREQQGKVVLEGPHLIRSALDADAVAQTVYFSCEDALGHVPVEKLRKSSIVKVQMDDPKVWSDVDTLQGIVAVFRRPEAASLKFPEERCGVPLPLTVICDNLRDPGNLGAVLLSAAAAGCHSVLLTKGCVDIWEPKVLRASMGAHFRLPIIPSLTWSDISSHLPKAAIIHVADNCTIRGLSDDHTATPRKQKKASDYGWVRGPHHHPMKMQNEDEESDRFMQRCESLQTQSYYSDWTVGHTGIVIGGETHGLSADALQLAERTGGHRILIPMVQSVDSLNSAMAASILLIEGRRQLLSKAQHRS